jgi:hypothetical protein
MSSALTNALVEEFHIYVSGSLGLNAVVDEVGKCLTSTVVMT